MIDKIILLLFEVGLGVKFNLVGEISLSELFLVISSIYYLKKIHFKKNKEVRTLSILYLVLILVQIITELIIGNHLSNAAKGIAINIVSYLHFVFLYYYFRKKRSLISFVLLGIILRYILFGTDIREFDVGDTKFVYFLKFYLVPIMTYTLLYITSIQKKWNMSIVIGMVGISFIALGARSGGLILFFTSTICFFMTIKDKLHIRKFGLLFIFITSALYGSYCIYVQKVISGEIKSGNTEQLLRAANPYNPINLLLMGRTEVFVGYIAFTDKLWTGWGAWAKDPKMKYNTMQFKLANKEYNSGKILNDIIPAHSVIFGSAMMNGIFALIIISTIFIYIIRKASRAIIIKDKYQIIIILFFINFLWHMIFSPMSVFRNSIPTNMAFIIISYQYITYKRTKYTQDIRLVYMQKKTASSQLEI